MVTDEYEVWLDDETSIQCSTLDEALVYATKGPYPITARTRLGDERIGLVEDLASSWLNGEPFTVPMEIVRAARKSMRDAEKNG